jgi:hypothetical protein
VEESSLENGHKEVELKLHKKRGILDSSSSMVSRERKRRRNDRARKPLYSAYLSQLYALVDGTLDPAKYASQLKPNLQIHYD